MRDELKTFRASLFWDVDPKKLDPEQHARFIIGRVLDYGDVEEWRRIEKLYGRKKIASAAKKHVFTDPRSANFWELILDLPKKSLSCTRKRPGNLITAWERLGY